jgi:hypothetical protein
MRSALKGGDGAAMAGVADMMSSPWLAAGGAEAVKKSLRRLSKHPFRPLSISPRNIDPIETSIVEVLS